MGFTVKSNFKGFREQASALMALGRQIPGMDKKWSKGVWLFTKKKAAKRGRGSTQSQGQWNKIAASVALVGNRIIVNDGLGNMHENKTREIKPEGNWLKVYFKGVSRTEKADGIIKTKAGNLLLVQYKGDNIRPLAVLKRKVTIKPRPWMPTQRQILKVGERILDRAMRKAKL